MIHWTTVCLSYHVSVPKRVQLLSSAPVHGAGFCLKLNFNNWNNYVFCSKEYLQQRPCIFLTNHKTWKKILYPLITNTSTLWCFFLLFIFFLIGFWVIRCEINLKSLVGNLIFNQCVYTSLHLLTFSQIGQRF